MVESNQNKIFDIETKSNANFKLFFSKIGKMRELYENRILHRAFSIYEPC